MKQFFCDGEGELSMGRLLSFITTCGGLVIFCVSAVVAIMHGVDIGANIVNGCIGLTGVGVVGKGISKFGEKG